MRTRILLLTPLVLAAMLSASSRAAVASRTVVPFRYDDNRMVVRCYVNGRGPFSFVVDTGSINVIDRSVATALGLRVARAGASGGVGNVSVTTGTTTVRSLRVGGLRFSNVSEVVLDLAEIRNGIGLRRFDGVLGMEVLQRFAVGVDPDRQTLAFDASAPPAPLGAHVVPFTGALPHVPATIEGIAGTVILDTGDRSSLTLPNAFAAKHGYFKRPGALTMVLTGFGIGGPVYGDVFRIKRFDVFGFRVNGVVTRASRQRGGAFASMTEAGSVGGGVLRRFNIVYDYPKSRLIVWPSHQFAIRDPYDRSGMWLSKADGAVVIRAINAGGPAAKAGLLPGDTIVSVNATVAKPDEIGPLRRLLAGLPPHAKVVVRSRRNGTTSTRTLVLWDRV